ncbi:uncharacterized protein LOC126751369 [Bactrocera neohumeralis]|uniref:uncharacterized protein LOC126751369 n=1 Tax=Bactrocera neohumeralis TaxID=98809 RepID=UPI002165A0B9|nr:uncharacterized protein LOC126751369 [Bactrocera neohumeralis]
MCSISGGQSVDLPLRPRARVWLPAEPSTSNEIEEILKYCNPSLPTHDWRVIRLERTDEPYQQALIMLNEESIGPLSKTKGAISYVFKMVVLKVLPTDTRTDGTQAADAGEKADGVSDGQATIENDPNLSDVASSGGGSSIGDSVFSLEQLFEEVRVDYDMSAELALQKESLKDEIPPDYCNADIVTAKLECDTGNVWIISAYMPHDDAVEPPPVLLRKTLAEASRNGADVIIGSDANSRHSIWGSSDANNRGGGSRPNPSLSCDCPADLKLEGPR